ncbi:MAG: type II toxin-antitoxin system VapC family toxin [Chloroflexota bacterium]|nr:type II toxin-antitoxin system VapC family toxin [Chloroflexota bacterium]
MKLLLDTHTFIWWITDNPQISPKIRRLMSDGSNEIFFSAASGWEIAIKARLGRLELNEDLSRFIPTQLSENAFSVLPIELSHTLHTYHLPYHHRDPFDRLLIAQSQLEKMPLASNDQLLAGYDVELIW